MKKEKDERPAGWFKALFDDMKFKDFIGKKADEYYAFMQKEGLSRKLYLHDMQKIFNHFKENWR